MSSPVVANPATAPIALGARGMHDFQETDWRRKAPRWVAETFAFTPASAREVPLGVTGLSCALHVSRCEGFAMVSCRLARARRLSAEGFRAATMLMYSAIRASLMDADARHPLRIWNCLPGIHDIMEDGLDRYRVFNLGRFDAFGEWFGDKARFSTLLPTATAVGHDGDDLSIHALGSAALGRPLENPRQIPAYNYSTRHGPCPPSFARATFSALPCGPRLMIGGTASVRAEDSVHPDSLDGQLEEIFANLGALLGPASDSLALIEAARVYFRHPRDAGPIEKAVSARFVGANQIEMIRADICRRELLVEIEAVAAPGMVHP